MAEVVLDGCRSEPLGSYLKALGVFRLVSEQLDRSVTARWQVDRLVLQTDQTREDLVEFFIHRYRPTPIVSPWNGGSGFFRKDKKDGIAAVEESSDERLEPYQRVIRAARFLIRSPRWQGLGKEGQVEWCRNTFPEEALPWLDAAVVLAEDGAVFPPLLGTGGNVGRLEYSNNFMQRLVDVLALGGGRGAATKEDSGRWLRSAIFGGGTAPLKKAPIGQYDPRAAGSTNAVTGGPEESVVNPWDFVLTFEGAPMFASGAARRMGSSGRGRAAMPFTFDSTPVGYSSAAEDEESKGELWAPLWSRSATLSEIRRLISEGRVDWGRQHGRRGIDAVRAAATLGVDRGIDGFVRHALVVRNGQATLAVPVGRVEAATRTRPEVSLLAALDPWIDRVRRARNLPHGPASALRRLDAAIFDLSSSAADGYQGKRRLQDVLIAAAELEQSVARSGSLRDQVPVPLGAGRFGRPRAWHAADWLGFLDDRSSEFRLAVALASCVDQKALWAGLPGHRRRDVPAALLRGVQRLDQGDWEWRPDGRAVVPGLGASDLTTVLGAFIGRRVVDVTGRDNLSNGTRDEDQADERHEPQPMEATQTVAEDAGQVGVQPAYRYRIPGPVECVGQFIDHALDEPRLSRLIAGLLLLRFDGGVKDALSSMERQQSVPLGTAAALILPFFHGRPMRIGIRSSPSSAGDSQPSVVLRPASNWVPLLAAGRTEDVVRDALHRLRVAGLKPLVRNPWAMSSRLDPNAHGPRLLAAAAFPLTSFGASSLLGRVATTSQRLDELNNYRSSAVAGAES